MLTALFIIIKGQQLSYFVLQHSVSAPRVLVILYNDDDIILNG